MLCQTIKRISTLVAPAEVKSGLCSRQRKMQGLALEQNPEIEKVSGATWKHKNGTTGYRHTGPPYQTAFKQTPSAFLFLFVHLSRRPSCTCRAQADSSWLWGNLEIRVLHLCSLPLESLTRDRAGHPYLVFRLHITHTYDTHSGILENTK